MKRDIKMVLKSACCVQNSITTNATVFIQSLLTSKPSCFSDPDSAQSQEEVLALNAAAIIANIKLQRQLSKKKGTPSGDSESDSTAFLKGNAGIITHLCH